MSLHLLCAVALMAVSEPVSRPTPGHSRSRTDPAVRDGEAAPGLVSAAREGDAEAFAELYAEHRASVYRLLLARTRSTTLADDLTSETFCRAWGAMSQFHLDEQYFGAWLRRIARNLAVDHFRSRARALELTTADLSHLPTDPLAGPEEAVLPGVHSEELRVAMSRCFHPTSAGASCCGTSRGSASPRRRRSSVAARARSSSCNGEGCATSPRVLPTSRARDDSTRGPRCRRGEAPLRPPGSAGPWRTSIGRSPAFAGQGRRTITHWQEFANRGRAPQGRWPSRAELLRRRRRRDNQPWGRDDECLRRSDGFRGRGPGT